MQGKSTVIRRNQLYNVSRSVKNSITGEWTRENVIVRGTSMRVYGYHIEPHYRVLTFSPSIRYEVDDGHLPGYRPVVTGDQLDAFMAEHDYRFAQIAR